MTVSNIHTSSEDSIVILSKVNQISRLRVGAEVFGSTHSPRYIKSANVLSQFVIDDNTTDIYPGQVQFFFEHTIQLPEGPATHSILGRFIAGTMKIGKKNPKEYLLVILINKKIYI